MKLENINKQRYRKHLNIVIVIGIVSLAALSLAISQSAIYFFTDREGTHFWLNLMGVVIATAIIGFTISRYKEHDFMTEVYYVWRLKQQINYIHRKHQVLEQAIKEDNVTAMTAMAFYFEACRQLYDLDDNTITLSALNKKANELEEKINSLNLNINVANHHQDNLQKF